ncbi:hypothetical protein FUAX_51680 (plasmid) [Fulvitalea axinellae]|uniref:YhhN-like protein n=1 Tax=Fulvitalea axinellae TaxID=1182444 RepID=A0AAU9CUL8_9BACT|nr:hypothetical protein FUAX_51680 [Fulvitalea axinellae]
MNAAQIWEVTSLLPPVVLWLSLVVAAYSFKHLDMASKWLSAFMLMSCLIDLTSRYVGDNLFLLPILGFFELLIFSVLYYKHWLRSDSKIFLAVIVGIVVLIIVDTIFLGNLFAVEEYRSYGKVISSLAIMGYGLMFIGKAVGGKIRPTPAEMRLNASVLGYFSVSCLISLSVNFLVNEHLDLVRAFWQFYLLVTVFFYSHIIFHIWRTGRTRKRLRFG